MLFLQVSERVGRSHDARRAAISAGHPSLLPSASAGLGFPLSRHRDTPPDQPGCSRFYSRLPAAVRPWRASIVDTANSEPVLSSQFRRQGFRLLERQQDGRTVLHRREYSDCTSRCARWLTRRTAKSVRGATRGDPADRGQRGAHQRCAFTSF